MPVDTLDPTWINSPTPGAGPSYDSEELRRNQGFTLVRGATSGSARGGLLAVGDLELSLSGSNVRMGPGGCAVPTDKGPYVTGLAAVATVGTLTPADVTNPRRDRVIIQILDPDNGGTAGRKGQATIIPGAPNASAATGGGYPAEPPGPVLTIGYVDVPKSGAGSPTVTMTSPFTAAAGAPIPVRSLAERDAMPKWDGLRVVRLDQGGAMDVCMSGAWAGPSTNYGAVSPSGYATTGNVTVETKGSRKQVTVDLTIRRTGANTNIGTDWTSFGQVLPFAVLGASDTKYLAAWMSGGTNNIPVGISVSPSTGVMTIRGAAAFSWTTNALISINCTYYI